MLMPFCHGESADSWTSGEHWMLLVADVLNRTVGFINSKPTNVAYQQTGAICVEKWMLVFFFLLQL